MSTLIMWHNRFSENENETVEAHIPRHRDSKTKKPRHRDSKAKKPRHRETETINPRHRDSKTFFQRTKSHDIEIPRLNNHDIEIPRPKNRDIEFLWNSDPDQAYPDKKLLSQSMSQKIIPYGKKLWRKNFLQKIFPRNLFLQLWTKIAKLNTGNFFC